MFSSGIFFHVLRTSALHHQEEGKDDPRAFSLFTFLREQLLLKLLLKKSEKFANFLFDIIITLVRGRDEVET